MIFNTLRFLSNAVNFPEPNVITKSNVLVVVWEKELTDIYKWNNPSLLAEIYQRDILDASRGSLNYVIKKTIDIDDFPIMEDGNKYNLNEFISVIDNKTPIYSLYADYNKMVDRINKELAKENDSNLNYDEIWMFGAPWMGFYESRMVGRNPIWVNSGGLFRNQKKQVIMGFNYERGSGEMLENFGHMAESIMRFVEPYLWSKFIKDCGSVHCPPNTTVDYDWGNETFCTSNHRAWMGFSDKKYFIIPRNVNCTTWGNGDMRLHHLWWLSHLPENWWQYLGNMSIIDKYQSLYFIKNIFTKGYYKNSNFEA